MKREDKGTCSTVEAAAKLGISPGTVRKMWSTGKLRGFVAGEMRPNVGQGQGRHYKLRISVDSIEELLSGTGVAA